MHNHLRSVTRLRCVASERRFFDAQPLQASLNIPVYFTDMARFVAQLLEPSTHTEIEFSRNHEGASRSRPERIVFCQASHGVCGYVTHEYTVIQEVIERRLEIRVGFQGRLMLQEFLICNLAEGPAEDNAVFRINLVLYGHAISPSEPTKR